MEVSAKRLVIVIDKAFNSLDPINLNWAMRKGALL